MMIADRKFVAGFLSASILAAVVFAAWHKLYDPLQHHVVATRPFGLWDSESNRVVVVPARQSCFPCTRSLILLRMTTAQMPLS
jgi:hypothetical protein